MKTTSAFEVYNVFAETLSEIVTTVSGISLNTLPAAADAGFDEIIGVTNLIGSKAGVFFVSANEEDIRIISSFMTGTPKDEVTKDDINDTMCEIVNITAGNVKLRVSDTDYRFTFTVPYAICGQSMSIVVNNSVQIFSSVLKNDEISLKVKLVY